MAFLRHILPIMLCLICCGVHAQDAKKIVFSCWIPPELAIYQELETLYHSAFATLGYAFEMHYRPTQRSLVEAEGGVSDGDCLRDIRYLRTHPRSHLRVVDVIIAHSDLTVWSRNPNLQINDFAILKKEGYRVAYERGHQSVYDLITKAELTQVEAVPTTAVGLKMLSAGRIDLFIQSTAIVQLTLDTLALDRPIYPVGTLWQEVGYPMLNAKHQDLVNPLQQALAEQVPEGGLQVP